MSYNIYTTKGIILSARPIREADRLYSILTRDLGLIYARALGVRKEVSKLRPGLEPVSLSDISLVKGQAYWRLTSSSLNTSMLTIERSKKKIALALLRALALLEKLVQGEEKHKELFDTVEEIFLFSRSEFINNDHAESIEIILVARILNKLGYLGNKDIPEGVLEDELSVDLLQIVAINKRKMFEFINLGLRSTELV